MAGSRRLTELLQGVSARLDLPDGPLVVALSGGADSATLLYLCADLGTQTRALHVNHGLAHSDMMESAASDVAQRIGIDLDVVVVAVQDGPSPEGQARRARYSAFAYKTSERERLLTGHTRDDSVETTLMNLVRGTGPRGLAGIPSYRSPNIHRPMLKITRNETREIATLALLGFVDDPMNDDPMLTRNIVRSQVIPLLSTLNPRLADSVKRLSAAVAADNAYLDRAAAQIPLQVGDRSAAVAIGDLLAAPGPVADRLLKMLLTQVVGRGGVTADTLERTWSVVLGSSVSQDISSGVVVGRRGAMLVAEAPKKWADVEDVSLTPGRHRSGRVEFDVLSHDGPCRVAPLSAWQAIFPADTKLAAGPDGVVTADGEPAWTPGEKRHPVAWYEPGSVGYLSIFAKEVIG